MGIDKAKDVIYDSNYTDQIEKWWLINFDKSNLNETEKEQEEQKEQTKIEEGKEWQENEEEKVEENKMQEENEGKADNSKKEKTWNKKNSKKSKENKKSFIDKIFDSIFGTAKPSWKKKSSWGKDSSNEKSPLENKSLQEQLKHIINLPDDEYSDKLLTSKLRAHIEKVEKEYISWFSDYKTHIAPSYWELKWSNFNLSWIFGRTYYAAWYPSYLDALRTRDTMSFHSKWDMTWFIYPSDDAAMQSMLKRRATQLRAEMNEAESKWITVDSEVQLEHKDVESIRQKLATREERYFQSSFYTTIYAENEEQLNDQWKKFEQKIWWNWIRIKPATQRMDEWFNSCTPLCTDELWISRSMVTTSIAWSFPFISNDLIDNKWILYWVNLHTWGLVVFDRFSPKLANANSTVLATSWAGKSFTVKLEILRYLLLWIDVIVIDPENEYKSLIDKVWGTYVNIAVNSSENINPFDLPPKIEDVDYWKWDLLRWQIMNLIWLISVLLGWLSVEEEALLDTAIQQTYSLKDITFEEEDADWKESPLLEDLLNMLEWMEWWEQLALKLSKYVTWTFAKLFNNQTNVDLNSWLTVFSIRDLDESLKTPAMFNVLNFIWTKVRAQKRKRLLIVDEAWIMMQHDMSANFLFWLIKRARKYWLWVTTISQDVEDFVKSSYWKPIVANSAVNVLLKQSTSSIKSLDSVFWLSEAEKQKLVACNIWEWLFFAWNQHIAMKVLASPYEKDFIETNLK